MIEKEKVDMLAVLKIELKKAFGNKLFLLTLALGIVIVGISAYQNIVNYFEVVEMDVLQAETIGAPIDPTLPVFTPFTCWIGADYQYPMTSLFYLLLPLMAALAFGWSYCAERKSGYIKNIAVRTDKKNYYLAKYVAVFIAGGAVVAIPLLANFHTVACFIPAYTPDVFYNIYYSMHYHFLSELFYTVPLLYVAIILVLDFVFAGLIATVSLAVSFFIKNRYAVVLLPFLLLLGIHFLQSVLMGIFSCPVISPIDFLKAYSVDTITVWTIVPPILLLFLLTFGVTFCKGARDDVF